VEDTSNVEKNTSEGPFTDSSKETLDDTDDYVIGVEDVLSISVWGHETLSSPSTHVAPDGKINLPILGPVRAAGLTVAQLRTSISQLLVDRKYIKVKPEVTVTVVEFKSKKITLLGEVKSSGAQSFATMPSLVDAIAKAGGYTQYADLSAVRIISKDGTKKTVDMNKYMTAGGRELLPDLQVGDTIFIPRKKETVMIGPDGSPLMMPDGETLLSGDIIPQSGITITVSGSVGNPGRYTFFAAPTVIEALTRANWVNSESSLKSVRVIRGNPQSGGQIVVDVDRFIDTGNYSMLPKLESGDIIYVPEKLKEISILGAVRNPGNHKVDGSISLLDALALAGGLSDEANPRKIRITRELNNSFVYRDVSVKEFISGKHQNLNLSTVPKLMPGDAVVVSSKRNGFLSLVNTTRDVAAVIVSIATLFSLYQLVAR